jgi:DNA-binding beta-propeller fold protein YncE
VRTISRSVRLTVVCVAAIVTSFDAKAALLATEWANSSNLYSVNTTTGTATLIGNTGLSNLIGLVVDVDSTVYTISEEPNSRLWTLNPTTGAASLIGNLGFNLQEGDMTVDPITGNMYVADGWGDNLYIVNKNTATASLVGSFGAVGRDISGLQFIGSTLYGIAHRDGAVDALVTINKLTGTASFVGETGTNFGVISAFGRDPATGKVLIAGPLSDFGSNNQLFEINLTSGAATLVGPLTGMSASISGFSTSGDPVILNPVPEPTTAGLIGGTLLVLGVKLLRKRTTRVKQVVNIFQAHL